MDCDSKLQKKHSVNLEIFFLINKMNFYRGVSATKLTSYSNKCHKIVLKASQKHQSAVFLFNFGDCVSLFVSVCHLLTGVETPLSTGFPV